MGQGLLAVSGGSLLPDLTCHEDATGWPCGHHEELDADRLGGFHVRWYAYRHGRAVGPFENLDELTAYVTRHTLPPPDELLAPMD
ncbi:hypothetical protein QZH56_17950 [Streptomyces olivoreticuli]|uniref:hypothetical protein n=1 Tax=Streptomyces olivoreticuli TaxID=68246 RepID=UPI002659A839|nr:hypothetical protein [Streptomyces olivoreticuli]WKK27303.1 hypothetical protein QZH56_17950 [Streptomyces olivoreticuli]